MSYDIRARSRLVPRIPITSPQFVYRRARETDVRATFARARAALDPTRQDGEGRAKLPGGPARIAIPPVRDLAQEAPC